MLIQSLPQILEKIAKPMERIDKVTVIDTGAGTGGASSIAKTVTDVAGTGFEVLKGITGLDMTQILQNLASGKNTGLAEPPKDADVPKDDTP